MHISCYCTEGCYCKHVWGTQCQITYLQLQHLLTLNPKMDKTVDMCTERVYCKKSMVSYKIVTKVMESTSDPSGHTGAD